MKEKNDPSKYEIINIGCSDLMEDFRDK